MLPFVIIYLNFFQPSFIFQAASRIFAISALVLVARGASFVVAAHVVPARIVRYISRNQVKRITCSFLSTTIDN
jgi:hypothetical protein